MKAILIILVVALGGLTYKFQLDAKSAKAKMIAAEDAEHAAKAEAKEASSELEKATLKIAQLEKSVASYLSEIDTLKRAEIAEVTAPKAEPAPAPAATAPRAAEVVATMQARLDEMETIYNQNLSQINDLRAKLAANETRVKGAIKTMEENPPTFAEQGTRERFGIVTNSGVRTSAADRKEAIEKHKTDLDALTAQLAAIEEERIKLLNRESELNKAYYAARSKIIEP